MSSNNHFNEHEDKREYQKHENRLFLNVDEDNLEQLKLILKKTIDEIELVRSILNEQRQQLNEQTKRRNDLFLKNIYLKQQIKLLEIKEEKKNSFISSFDTSETELVEHNIQLNEQNEKDVVYIDCDETDEENTDDDETIFELFEPSQQSTIQSSKSKESKKPIKVPQLQYKLYYNKLLKTFHSQLKNRQNITFVDNYIAIESRYLFSEYCNQNDLSIPDILDTSNSTRSFYKTNVFLFNRGIKRLEELRESKGMKPLFQLGNNGRYPCILYIGIDKVKFI